MHQREFNVSSNVLICMSNNLFLFETMENWNNGKLEDLSKILTSYYPILTSLNFVSMLPNFHHCAK